MNINSIHTNKDHNVAMKRAIAIFNAVENNPENKELEILLPVLKEYEDKHFEPILKN